MTAAVFNRLGEPGVLLHGISIKPGKPTIVAVAGRKPLFGLPGNPVSALVVFDLLVSPAIHLLSGASDPPTASAVNATLTEDIPSGIRQRGLRAGNPLRIRRRYLRHPRIRQIQPDIHPNQLPRPHKDPRQLRRPLRWRTGIRAVILNPENPASSDSERPVTAEPQLFRINPENRESEKITEVEFSQLGFQERRDIQEWIAANPGILGEDLLIIGKEFSGFDRTNERLDLLAVDVDGKLVVIELKRDHTGADAHWQAIKYASYIHRARREDIIRMFASYANISESEAVNQLLRHLGADDLNGLNNDQRIILASHRFAPEVTSASLWLNEKTDDENLITCVQLIPYHDVGDDSLYIQVNTIIPMPGVEEYSIGIGDSKESEGYQSDFGIKLRRTFQRNRDDEVTEFLRKVASMTSVGLPEEIKPDMNSRWGRGVAKLSLLSSVVLARAVE